jgi:hypothetical protein
LRRYGIGPAVFLERKSRWGDRVAKRRTLVSPADIGRLEASIDGPEWDGHWFHRRLRTCGLWPACQVSCERTAFVGTSADGPLRVTLDRQALALPARSWDLEETRAGLPILTGRVILELKFRASLPVLFKHLIQEMGLCPGPVSKYRLAVEAWGQDATQAVDKGRTGVSDLPKPQGTR